jgi:hypothetical protein
VNKTANDDKITELVLELQKSLPKLDVWDAIYPTESMTILVAEVYKEVIVFAREASVYFTKFSSEYPHL